MTGRIRGFDGLRAVAVLAVFLGHRSPLHGLAIGHVGVLVFFALSGYLIVGILNGARRSVEAGESSAWAQIKRFFAHRTRRIFPVYYLVLAGLTVAALAGLPAHGWRWDSLPWHLAYLSNLYEGLTGAWQGALSHLWSLSIEEWFYLLAAPLLIALPSRFHLPACVLAVLAGLASHLSLLVAGANPVAVYTDSLTNFGFIALGGALRLNADAGQMRYAGRLAWPLIPLLLAMGLVPDYAAEGGWLVAAPILAALFVLAVAQAQASRLVALLELPPLVYMGRISYGFYLFHNLFWIVTPLHGAVGVVVGMTLNFALSFALAGASWRFFEEPILRWRRRGGAVAA